MREDFIAEVTMARRRPQKRGPRGFGNQAKEEVVELWTETGDILTSLKIKAEPVGGGDPVLVDFKKDRFSVKLPVSLTDGAVIPSDVYATIVKYYNDNQLGSTGL